MSLLTLWNSAPVRSWEHEVERFFDDALGSAVPYTAFAPAVDLVEEDDHYSLHVDLPGVKKEDIHLEAKDGQLSLTGERKFEKRTKAFAERFEGKFQRLVNLPADVDGSKVSATYVDGVLSIQLGKSEAAKPRLIKVDGGKITA